MNILITSATNKEIILLKERLTLLKTTNNILSIHKYKNITIDFLVSKISAIPTCYFLTKALLNKRYNLVLNAGIAGSFKKNINIGSVVNVVSEQFSDLGIEDKKSFFTLFEKRLLKKDRPPFKNGMLLNKTNFSLHSINKIPKVTGITSNTVHGNKNTIEFIGNKFNPDIESMEGAAFFYVCLQENIPFVEIRSISNFVEERNTQKWDIPLAIKNLNNSLFEIIEEINLKTKF